MAPPEDGQAPNTLTPSVLLPEVGNVSLFGNGKSTAPLKKKGLRSKFIAGRGHLSSTKR